MREKLASTLGYVFWSDLRAHAGRDALIIVADDLDIVDVGVAVARNDTTQVERWINEKKLTKPTAQDLALWPADPLAQFESLIVAPFVLIRPQRRRASEQSN